VTLPPVVKSILKADFIPEATRWPRLHRREKKVPGYSVKGYGLKLLYVLDSARAANADGVVACVDADKETRRERLKQMKVARQADRSERAGLPAALGEARPHNEAWLLDDPVAVREGLRLPQEHAVPNVAKCGSPKAMLEALHQESERTGERPIAVWAHIAARVDPARCAHRKKTGLQALVAEVQAELGPLFATGT
jgi:hypothetical protein